MLSLIEQETPFHRALALGENDDALSCLGQLYQRIGQKQAAVEVNRILFQKNPNDTNSLLKLVKKYKF